MTAWYTLKNCVIVSTNIHKWFDSLFFAHNRWSYVVFKMNVWENNNDIYFEWSKLRLNCTCSDNLHINNCDSTCNTTNNMKSASRTVLFGELRYKNVQIMFLICRTVETENFWSGYYTLGLEQPFGYGVIISRKSITTRSQVPWQAKLICLNEDYYVMFISLVIPSRVQLCLLH